MATTSTQTRQTAHNILHNIQPPHTFHFSPFLRTTHQVGLPPSRPICRAFNTGHCPNGTRCSERHVTDPSLSNGGGPTGGLNSLVCKHWLRGLCKKGEACEFLHEYNLRKMPECNFFMRNGYCSNGDECLYLHIDPLTRLPPCEHYEMGFCPLGPECSKKHVRRKVCLFYLAGFCPDGPECRDGHPKWREGLERPMLKSEKREEEEAATQARIEAARAQQAEDEAMGRDGGDGGGRGGRFDRGGRGGWRGRGGRGRGFRGRH